MKILIVDDDRRRQDSLSRHLAATLSVPITSIVAAESVDQAKRLLRSTYFDVLILDVVLPKRPGETASAVNGVELLNQLSREAYLRKPEKIIGITAHTDDIAAFREQFLSSCVVVVGTAPGSAQWRDQIARSLGYTGDSMLSRVASNRGIAVLTVHGIRTYGQWQTRLRRLVENRTDLVDFHNYKYGYFSTFSFLIPLARDLEAKRLLKHLRTILPGVQDKDIVVFCHSFGTLLVARAFEVLLQDSEIHHLRIVMCGSVLPSNFSWTFLDKHSHASVVNDCGSSDYVLWASSAFALGLGMAGKTGFLGFSNHKVMNRYFQGSHGIYFKGNGFMEKFWLPLLFHGADPVEHDERQDAGMLEMSAESFVKFLTLLKPVAYGVFAAMLVGYAIALAVSR